MSGFDPGSKYYASSKPMRGGEALSDRFSYTEKHNVFGATVDDGKAEAFQQVKAGLNYDALRDKADAWKIIHDDTDSVTERLNSAASAVFGAWSGDDADKARTIFAQTSTSATALTGYANQMHQSTNTMAEAVRAAVGTSSDGPGFGSRLSGGLGLGGGDGDGNKDEQAYWNLLSAMNTGRDTMPTKVESQNKPDDGASQLAGYHPSAHGSGASGVGGVSSPGVGATPQHASTSTHGIAQAPQFQHPGSGENPGNHNQDPVISDPSAQLDPNGGSSTSGLGAGSAAGNGAGYDSSGLGSPGLDTGSSLAGFDPNGGGAGLGGGSAGLGSGTGVGVDAAGSGLGAAGLGGSGGGLAGAGAGGLAGSGAGVAGDAGAAAGAIAPMRGAGGAGGGDEDERERSTWLHEDDDVWGESDAPPAVIS